MRVLILGGDGYLGWPTAMDLAAAGHEVAVADNYLRRLIAERTDSEALIPTPTLNGRARLFEELTGKKIAVHIGDLGDPEVMFDLVRDFHPDTIVHYAEQPSAPYSMMGFREARETFKNNLDVTFNVIWAVMEHARMPHRQARHDGRIRHARTSTSRKAGSRSSTRAASDKFLFPRAGRLPLPHHQGARHRPAVVLCAHLRHCASPT